MIGFFGQKPPMIEGTSIRIVTRPGETRGQILVIVRMAAILFIVLIAGALGPADAQEGLKLGTEGAYPPGNTTTPAGDLVGFDIDLGYALCAEMNVESTFVTQEWDGIIPALNAGQYDTIVSSLSITEERERMIDFSIPYE